MGGPHNCWYSSMYSEPRISTDQQPKKRRRKDVTKVQGGTDGRSPNKLVKTGNKSKKVPSLIEGISAGQLHSVTASNMHNADADSLMKKGLDAGITAVPLGTPNVDAIRQDKDSDHQRNQVLLSQNLNSKQKESRELQGSSAQRSNDRSSYGTKIHSGKNSAGEFDQAIQRKERIGTVENFDLNVSGSKNSLQVKVIATCVPDYGDLFFEFISLLANFKHLNVKLELPSLRLQLACYFRKGKDI